MNLKKLVILNLPYLLFVYPFDKLAQAFRLAPGADLSAKILSIGDGFTAAFSSLGLSLAPVDLLIGIAGAVILRLTVYMKGKNAKKYRHGMEYGSARWGTAADIAPYMDKDFFQNIPMTMTERITMSSRPKQPKYARNKNILVIGGSGSGKTRFFCKPSLLQGHSSYVCTDPKGTLLPEIGTFLERHKLYVAMNLSFACSLRMGEILGLTWDNVHISDEDIAADNAYVYVDKELTRASKRAIETLGEKDIYYIFTPLMPNTSTRIILKKPKTESSIRKVWLPKTLAYILREWKKSQDELRSFLGDEYQDFNLVVALPNGRPCEDRIILKEFSKLREEAGLPRVVFHSLRHSSTTYKLKLNHGDLKATQGDTGHAEIDMITSIYAHILDEDRKVNAQKFETAFYANPDLRGVRPPEEPKEPEPATLDLASLVEQLQKSPELASALAALIAAQAPAK